MHRFHAVALAFGLAGCGIAGAVTEAAAQARPSTLAMTCGQAQSLVRSRGAIVLSTGRFTYDRFVTSRRFCTPDEEEVPTWAPTRDTPQCMVGFRCEMRRSWRFDR